MHENHRPSKGDPAKHFSIPRSIPAPREAAEAQSGPDERSATAWSSSRHEWLPQRRPWPVACACQRSQVRYDLLGGAGRRGEGAFASLMTLETLQLRRDPAARPSLAPYRPRPHRQRRAALAGLEPQLCRSATLALRLLPPGECSGSAQGRRGRAWLARRAGSRSGASAGKNPSVPPCAGPLRKRLQVPRPSCPPSRSAVSFAHLLNRIRPLIAALQASASTASPSTPAAPATPAAAPPLPPPPTASPTAAAAAAASTPRRRPLARPAAFSSGEFTAAPTFLPADGALEAGSPTYRGLPPPALEPAFRQRHPGLLEALAAASAGMTPATAAQLLRRLEAELPPALHERAPGGDSMLVAVGRLAPLLHRAATCCEAALAGGRPRCAAATARAALSLLSHLSFSGGQAAAPYAQAAVRCKQALKAAYDAGAEVRQEVRPALQPAHPGLPGAVCSCALLAHSSAQHCTAHPRQPSTQLSHPPTHPPTPPQDVVDLYAACARASPWLWLTPYAGHRFACAVDDMVTVRALCSAH